MSDSVTPWHARPPCPSPTPRVYSNLCPLSQWCHPTISSSVIPFSSCLQSFPTSGSFQISQFFASGGQSIEVSASASVLLMNIQDWFPLELTDLISLQSKGPSRVFSNTTVQKHQFFGAQLSLWSNSHIHTQLLEKPQLWLDGLCQQSNVSAFFNMLSKLVIAFLLRSKCLNFLATFSICSDFGAQENSLSLFPLFPHHLPWSDGTRCHDLSFLNVGF